MNRYFGLHTLEGEWHSLLPRYLLLAERVAGRRILDIGCGTGIGSSLLLELGAEHVDAIDYRPAVLEVARMKHAKPGLDFHVMFWEELDFDDHSFDMVICLDPSSPVTDRNLLLEMRRVLKPGGEYICAVERKNLQGIESVLPRYGYADLAEKIDRHTHHERVPQLGALTSFFETIVSVSQQPHLSYIFDVISDANSPLGTDVPPNDEMRKVSSSGDSGLWTGPAKINADHHSDELKVGEAHESSERWITMDRRFCSQRDEAGVEILFCGDSYLAPAPVREVRLPYFPLVERLHEMSSALQSRSRGALLEEDAGLGPLSDDGIFPEAIHHPSAGDFYERTSTAEYLSINDWEDHQNTSVSLTQQNLPYATQSADPSYGYAPAQHHDHHAHNHTVRHQPPAYQQPSYPPTNTELNDIHAQLAHVGNLYQQVRSELEDLVFDTRRELAERDRYIEHLVNTIHHWEKSFHDSQTSTQETDRESTGIFTKSSLTQPESHQPHHLDDHDEPKTTIFSLREGDLDNIDNIDNIDSNKSSDPADDLHSGIEARNSLDHVVKSTDPDDAHEAAPENPSSEIQDDKEEHSV